MKKLFIQFIIFVLTLAFVAPNVQASLWEYFKGDLPGIEYRAKIAENAGICYEEEYRGTYDQNIALEAYLRGGGSNYAGISPVLGAVKPIRPSGFETTLSSGLASEGTETTLVVNSLDLPDGTTVDDATYGDLLILTVGEGDYEEKIAVTTLNETTKTFTIYSRGLKYGEWASTTDNMHQHMPGELVYVSNDDHWMYQQYVDLESDQTLSGDVTYTGNVVIPTYTSSDITYAANIGYVNDIATSGVADASETVAGKSEISTGAEAAAGTSSGGSGALLVLPASLATSTPGAWTSGNNIPVLVDGRLEQYNIDLTETFAFTGNNAHAGTETFNATTTFTADVSGTERFGGDGTDGVLDTSSGAVQIDIATSGIVVKNYTSINIVTNNLTFINSRGTGTVIILKSEGACTISATIDLTSLGGAGGAAGATSNGDGGDGVAASYWGIYTQDGTAIEGGGGGVGNTFGTAGVKGASIPIHNESYMMCVGSGGGGGEGSTEYLAGAGGDGAGALIIECGGALNFSGTINASGDDGIDAVGGNNQGAGGGGAGAGGSVMILYNTLIANSGSIDITGGDGGDGYNSSNVSNTNGKGGGGGGSCVSEGGSGAVGSGGTAAVNPTVGGTAGTNPNGTRDGGAGAGGASGWYTVLPYINPSN